MSRRRNGGAGVMAEKPATSLGPVPLLEGIALSVAAGPEGWVTSFTRGGETIAEDRAVALPWIDPRATGRLTNRLHEAVPLDRKAIRAALLEVFETVRSSPDAGALVSGSVARVIGETAAVSIEESDPPVYIVDLADGGRLIFQNRELADPRPATLNERWLAAHPGDALDANGRDFKTVRDYWFGIAERAEPSGAGSQWEPVAEALQRTLSTLPASTGREGLLRYGLYLEERPGGSAVLWVASGIIENVLRDRGRSIMDRTFPEFLRRDGALVSGSRRFRIGGVLCRAWGFDPGFRPDNAGITVFENLIEEARP